MKCHGVARRHSQLMVEGGRPRQTELVKACVTPAPTCRWSRALAASGQVCFAGVLPVHWLARVDQQLLLGRFGSLYRGVRELNTKIVSCVVLLAALVGCSSSEVVRQVDSA